jgi:hypothetical protein
MSKPDPVGLGMVKDSSVKLRDVPGWCFCRYSGELLSESVLQGWWGEELTVQMADVVDLIFHDGACLLYRWGRDEGVDGGALGWRQGAGSSRLL